MRIKTSGRRKIRKASRAFKRIVSALPSVPFLKPVLLISVALCILLIILPYIITNLTPSDKPEKELVPEATFELTETPDTITVYRTGNNRTEIIDFEDYVKGVVSCEMPASFHIEALKAQAVAARTYSLSRVINADKTGNPEAHPQAPVCDSTHCQVYRSVSENKNVKGASWMESNWPKIEKAADSTRSQLLYYNGELAEQALFHSSSGGRTENCQDVFASAVPYLVSVESPYEDEATHQNETNSFTIKEISYALKSRYPNIDFGDISTSSIKIISRSTGGRVEKMRIGNGIIEGRNVREALKLPSAAFTIDISGDTVSFTSNGSGHGVGMSQYGADGMAKKSYTYRQILNHYYKGTMVY